MTVLVQIRAVATDPQDDVRTLDRERRVRSGIDVAELLDQRLHPGESLTDELRSSEVEVLQHLQARLVAGCNGVEDFFHRGGERVVHEATEVFFKQAHHGEGEPTWDERSAALGDVTAVDEHCHDRRIGTWSADSSFFKVLDQARLGVSSGRLRGVTLGRKCGQDGGVTLGKCWEADLLLTFVAIA